MAITRGTQDSADDPQVRRLAGAAQSRCVSIASSRYRARHGTDEGRRACLR